MIHKKPTIGKVLSKIKPKTVRVIPKRYPKIKDVKINIGFRMEGTEVKRFRELLSLLNLKQSDCLRNAFLAMNADLEQQLKERG